MIRSGPAADATDYAGERDDASGFEVPAAPPSHATGFSPAWAPRPIIGQRRRPSAPVEAAGGGEVQLARERPVAITPARRRGSKRSHVASRDSLQRRRRRPGRISCNR